MKALFRSHRTFGFEVARVQPADGPELVILQTAPHKQEVSPAHLLQSVSDAEATFEATMALVSAVERARFLGVDMDALRLAFEQAVNQQ